MILAAEATAGLCRKHWHPAEGAERVEGGSTRSRSKEMILGVDAVLTMLVWMMGWIDPTELSSPKTPCAGVSRPIRPVPRPWTWSLEQCTQTPVAALGGEACTGTHGVVGQQLCARLRLKMLCEYALGAIRPRSEASNETPTLPRCCAGLRRFNTEAGDLRLTLLFSEVGSVISLWKEEEGEVERNAKIGSGVFRVKTLQRVLCGSQTADV